MTFDVGIIGGSGRFGTALATRCAASGVSVFLGSRDPMRGGASSAHVLESLAAAGSAVADPDELVAGGANQEAAVQGRLVIIALPFDSLGEHLPPLAAALAGKCVVSAVVPMVFRQGSPELVPRTESVAQEVARLLPQSRVAGAFHSVSAATLSTLAESLGEDVLITTDDPSALEEVAAIVEQLDGARAVPVGGLAVSIFTEPLAILLVAVNRRHKVHAGITITGLP